MHWLAYVLYVIVQSSFCGRSLSSNDHMNSTMSVVIFFIRMDDTVE